MSTPESIHEDARRDKYYDWLERNQPDQACDCIASECCEAQPLDEVYRCVHGVTGTCGHCRDHVGFVPAPPDWRPQEADMYCLTWRCRGCGAEVEYSG